MTVAGLLAPGEIVLAHDGNRIMGTSLRRQDRGQAIGQLPMMLAALDARGLRSVPVSQLLA